jgi:hypothetical protein
MTTAILMVDVRDYQDGHSYGKIEIEESAWLPYAECRDPAYQWPEGIARAVDVLGDDQIKSLGIDPEATIWLEEGGYRPD